MPKRQPAIRLDPRTRLLLAGALLAVVMLLCAVFGVRRTFEMLSDLLSDSPAAKRERKGDDPRADTDARPAGKGEYLFCFWNVENLFDDADDGRTARGDPDYDKGFAADPEVLARKLSNLCDVLVPLNGGRGPDILALCEVESKRAADLLAEALNGRLIAQDRYTSVVLVGEPPSRTRHISPALITRLPVSYAASQRWTQKRRLFEATVTADGKALTLIVSHWTSRVSDDDGSSRDNYAKVIRARFESAFEADPAVDFLVCGDFNDTPEDRSVKTFLGATGDLGRVRGATSPVLFDLFARASAEGKGTIYDGAKPYLFDHVCVSPGLLDDRGWSCDPDSGSIVTSFANDKGRPHSFGKPGSGAPLRSRGYADHFPVTARLRVR